MRRHHYRSPIQIARGVLPSAILVAFAACSRDGSSSSSDTTSTFQSDLMAAEVPSSISTKPVSLPSDCATVDASRFASEVHGIDSARALLTRERGLAAELRGDVREAKTLLETSAKLDPGDASVAYHLGRVSEQLRDRDGAMSAYCHSLAIDATSSNASDATARIHSLAPIAPARAVSAPVARHARRSAPRAVAVSRVAEHVTPSPAPVLAPNAAPVAPSQEPVAPVQSTDNGTLAQPRTPPTDVRPVAPLPAPTARRTTESSNTTRDVVVGAGAGAIIGAVMGRNSKSAVIGGVAGGLLGAIIGRRTSH